MDKNLDAALAHISNALDDLESSPDQRPVPLLREAMACIRAATPQARPDGWDAQAYTNMRDDLESWKQRALNAEADMNRLCDQFNAENGPTHMGEPVLPRLVEQARPDGGEVVEKPCKECGGLVHVWANDDAPICLGCHADTHPAPAPDVALVVDDAMVDRYVEAVNAHLGGLTPKDWEIERFNPAESIRRVARIGLTAALAPFTAAQQGADR